MGASKQLKGSPAGSPGDLKQQPAPATGLLGSRIQTAPPLPNYSQAGFYQGSPEPIDSSGMPYSQAAPQAEPMRMAKAPAGKRQIMMGGQPYCPC